MLPEKDSSPDSEILARELADKFGVRAIKEEITGVLSGFKCYERRDEAVKNVFPEYDPATFKMKIGIKQSGLFSSLPPMFYLTIIDPNGNQKEKLLPLNEYLQIVAASNFKQRTRMSMLYYHAEAQPGKAMRGDGKMPTANLHMNGERFAHRSVAKVG